MRAVADAEAVLIDGRVSVCIHLASEALIGFLERAESANECDVEIHPKDVRGGAAVQHLPPGNERRPRLGAPSHVEERVAIVAHRMRRDRLDHREVR